MKEKKINNTLADYFIFSQSSLQDYLDCARRFQLRYIMQLKWPAVETAPVLENERRQDEGQQFHRLVHQYLIGLPAKKISTSANRSNYEHLPQWWNNFIEAQPNTLADLQGAKFAPEHTLSAPIGNHRIMAKYDLLAKNNDKITIYDWKTYLAHPKNEKMSARVQTRVYQSLLVRAGHQFNDGQAVEAGKTSMIYWFAEFPNDPAQFSYNEAKAHRDWDWLTALVHEISAKQSFPLTEDAQKCSFCPYRSFCERGIRPGSDEEMEIHAPASWDVNMEQVQEIEF